MDPVKFLKFEAVLYESMFWVTTPIRAVRKWNAQRKWGDQWKEKMIEEQRRKKNAGKVQ